MKKSLVFLVFITSFLSCSDDNTVLFSIENEARLVIDPGLNTFITHIYTIENVPTLTDLFRGGIDEASIDQIVANTAILRGTFFNQDFGFIENIQVYAISPSDPTNRAEIFFVDQVPLNHQGELRLFNSISNVKDIMLAETYNVEIRMRLRGFTSQEIDATLDMAFRAFAP